MFIHSFTSKHLFSTYCTPYTISLCGQGEVSALFLPSLQSFFLPRRDHTHAALGTWASGEGKAVLLRLRVPCPSFTWGSGCSSHRKICRLLAMVVVR